MREQPATLRCAVYTRKSTEEGLDQEFNSLDAQREACAAYIASQRHEGWIAVADTYDDGGFSGGNMERPGMKRLLADIEAGKVQVIVVYKVDRLTRSLADFAKIVDVLDAKGASFVSITQSFNTTTSMGRLTLNVLLSFAQFEREVTGERIRDKIAASKRKGLWMGGPVPLGYEVVDRKLRAVPEEAATVRHVMQRYLALGSVRELIDELAREGRITKIQNRTSGPHRGGVPFQRGTLVHLLKNRVYIGEIVHKSSSYPGEHEAIVDHELWDRVQQALAERGPEYRRRTNARHPSLLTGLIADGEGRPMSPSHAVKGSRRYRYYVTHRDHLERTRTPAWRVAAHDVEEIVIGEVCRLLEDRARLHDLVVEQGDDTLAVRNVFDTALLTCGVLKAGTPSQRLDVLQRLQPSVTLHEGRIEVAVAAANLMACLGMLGSEVNEDTITLQSRAVRVRRGHDVRLVIKPEIDRSEGEPIRNRKLVALLAEAQAARRLVLEQPARSLNAIAAETGRCRTRLGKLFAIGHLAPDIVAEIVEGRQSATLSHRRLMEIDLPLDWSEQRRVLARA